MAFSAAQLADVVAKAKLFMHIEDDDEQLAADGIAVFCSATDATAATVQVTDTQWIGIITGGTSAGTTTKTFANTTDDTLGELATTIEAASGWTANLLGNSGANSTLLYRLAATSCLGQSQEQVLRYENEEALELLATNALDAIETHLGREILSTTYTERYDSSGDRTLQLCQPNVSQITHLATSVEDGLTVKYTGSDEIARVEVTSTAVVTMSRTGDSATTTTSTFASNVTTTAMATTINALGGWTATVVNARPSAYLVQQGARDAKDTTQTLEVWEDSDLDYEVDYAAGVIDFRQRVYSDRGWIYVGYTAGYSSLPADLEQVILELIQAGWTAGTRDPGLQSERLGDYSWTRAPDTRAAMGVRLLEHETIIGKYRRWSA